jgi:hypothetical protein
MSFLKKLIAMVTVSLAASSPQVGAWKGFVMLYYKAHFNGERYPWFIDSVQRCYQLSCFNGTAMSANWKRLPQNSHIAFYKTDDCQGVHAEWSTDGKNFPLDFALDKMYDGISSFMVWENNSKPMNGYESPCN